MTQPKLREYLGVALGLGAGLGLWATGGAAQAEIRVTASIAPAHSLAAEVMRGVAEPTLLLPAGTSPHHYAMRPSDARALQEAKLVFWIGPDIEPWLEKPLETLPKGAKAVRLDEAPDLVRREIRLGGAWEEHDHGHHDEAHKSHGDSHGGHKHSGHRHDHKAHSHDHKSHGHDHKAHGHEHKGHDHAAGAVDPHYWLDPRNAAAWVEAMTAALVAADPANAERYKANAARTLDDLKTLEEELAAALAPVSDKPYVVFHDAYQYFEARFGLNAVGSVTLPDASAPSPSRLAEIQTKIRDSGAVCVFTEPQFPAKQAEVAAEGSAVRLAALDPLGAEIEPGLGHYAAMLRALAASLKGCLAGS